MSRRLEPPVPLHNPAFHYTSSTHTDIRERFKKLGFRPPSERRVIPLPFRKTK